MFTALFFSVLPMVYRRARWTIFTLNTSFDVDLRKAVLLGIRKFELKI